MRANLKFSLSLALTPALSPGERGNPSPSLYERERGSCRTVAGKTRDGRLLFPLPGGEGQGEGGRYTDFSARQAFNDHD
jgi:hypothetical protein